MKGKAGDKRDDGRRDDLRALAESLAKRPEKRKKREPGKPDSLRCRPKASTAITYIF